MEGINSDMLTTDVRYKLEGGYKRNLCSPANIEEIFVK